MISYVNTPVLIGTLSGAGVYITPDAIVAVLLSATEVKILLRGGRVLALQRTALTAEGTALLTTSNDTVVQVRATLLVGYAHLVTVTRLNTVARLILWDGVRTRTYSVELTPGTPAATAFGVV